MCLSCARSKEIRSGADGIIKRGQFVTRDAIGRHDVDGVAERAQQKQMNPKMLCSFTDGSKTMIEMSALANATGLKLSKRGMIVTEPPKKIGASAIKKPAP